MTTQTKLQRQPHLQNKTQLQIKNRIQTNNNMETQTYGTKTKMQKSENVTHTTTHKHICKHKNTEQAISYEANNKI